MTKQQQREVSKAVGRIMLRILTESCVGMCGTDKEVVLAILKEEITKLIEKGEQR
jgi:hypothetical protein